jgi:hypothetical protein
MAIPPITDLVWHEINMKMSVSYAIDYKLDNIARPLLPKIDLPIQSNYNKNKSTYLYKTIDDNLTGYKLDKEIDSLEFSLRFNSQDKYYKEKYLMGLKEKSHNEKMRNIISPLR